MHSMVEGAAAPRGSVVGRQSTRTAAGQASGRAPSTAILPRIAGGAAWWRGRRRLADGLLGHKGREP
jgi:hypothetical protein